MAQTKFVLHNVEENEKVKMLYGHSERLAIAYGLLKTAEEPPFGLQAIFVSVVIAILSVS